MPECRVIPSQDFHLLYIRCRNQAPLLPERARIDYRCTRGTLVGDAASRSAWIYRVSSLFSKVFDRVRAHTYTWVRHSPAWFAVLAVGQTCRPPWRIPSCNELRESIVYANFKTARDMTDVFSAPFDCRSCPLCALGAIYSLRRAVMRLIAARRVARIQWQEPWGFDVFLFFCP